MEDELLTLEDAARLAHVSRETIRYWIKVKRISKYPERISQRSGKPYGVRVKRGELLSSLTASKVSALEKELGDQLLTVGQVAVRLRTKPELVRLMVKKLGVQRHHLHNNNDFVVPFGQMLDLLQTNDWYYSYYAEYKLRHRYPNHRCAFCS
jgi:hypothetical protein